MQINRTIAHTLYKILKKNMEKTFDINTQYKFLTLSKEIEKDMDILKEQQNLLLTNYVEKDINGKYVMTKDGGYKIQEDKIDECNKSIYELNSFEIQLPDIYFTLDELKPLELTCNELNSFYSFIKT